MDKNELKAVLNDIIMRPEEEEWFELKSNHLEPKVIGEYISALSNVAADLGRTHGYLVWGVDNDTHEVKGTKFNHRQDVKNEPLEHFLARQLKPDLRFEFAELKVNAKRIVMLVVPAAKNSPTSFAQVRYIRIGSSKVKLEKYPDRESHLFHVLRNGPETMENTASDYQDLEFKKLMMYYAAKGVELNKRSFKKNLGFLTPDGKYNLLAQLMSDNSHVPIRFAVFNGEDKTSSMYTVREMGNTCLLYSLDDVLNYGKVLNIPQADERDRVVERKEVPLFNEKAFREAVINAFIHNRWLGGNAPMFTAYSNRIEITSHGNIPPGQTVEGFYSGVSVPVNQKLSDMVLQLHISERTGRGVPKIVEAYGQEVVQFHDGFITVDIPYERIDVAAPAGSPKKYSYRYDERGKTTQDVKKRPKIGEKTTQDVKKRPKMGEKTTQDEIANPALGNMLKRDIVADKILRFCTVPRGMMEIAEHINIKERKNARKHVVPLLEQGRLAMTMPEKPNSKNQKYVTIQETD